MHVWLRKWRCPLLGCINKFVTSISYPFVVVQFKTLFHTFFWIWSRRLKLTSYQFSMDQFETHFVSVWHGSVWSSFNISLIWESFPLFSCMCLSWFRLKLSSYQTIMVQAETHFIRLTLLCLKLILYKFAWIRLKLFFFFFFFFFYKFDMQQFEIRFISVWHSSVWNTFFV